MARYSASDERFAAFYYRNDLLTWRREQMGISIQEVGRRTGERFQTVRQVFRGKATNKKVYPVAKFLGLDWVQVHNLKLKQSEFHLAVLNGNGSKGGSIKAG